MEWLNPSPVSVSKESPADGTIEESLLTNVISSNMSMEPVKVKYGLGQSFRLPQSDPPKSLQPVPGVSVEALTP